MLPESVRNLGLPPALAALIAPPSTLQFNTRDNDLITRFAGNLWEGKIAFMPNCHARPISIHSTAKGGKLLLCQGVYDKNLGIKTKSFTLVYALIPSPHDAVAYYKSRMFSTPDNLAKYCPGSIGAVRIAFERKGTPYAIEELQSTINHAKIGQLAKDERHAYVNSQQSQLYFGWQSILANFAFTLFKQHNCKAIPIYSCIDIPDDIAARRLKFFTPAAAHHGYQLDPKNRTSFVISASAE